MRPFEQSPERTNRDKCGLGPPLEMPGFETIAAVGPVLSTLAMLARAARQLESSERAARLKLAWPAATHRLASPEPSGLGRPGEGAAAAGPGRQRSIRRGPYAALHAP